MMRSMRTITKPVFLVIAITFIGWMAYGQISDIIGGRRDVVLTVDSEAVRTPEFQQRYQAAAEQHRRSGPPPQILQQVLQDPTFQTNGQFDITKWQRYLSSAGPEVSAQIEQLYGAYLPQRAPSPPRGPEYRVP